jgi:hypothetical protein
MKINKLKKLRPMQILWIIRLFIYFFYNFLGYKKLVRKNVFIENLNLKVETHDYPNLNIDLTNIHPNCIYERPPGGFLTLTEVWVPNANFKNKKPYYYYYCYCCCYCFYGS